MAYFSEVTGTLWTLWDVLKQVSGAQGRNRTGMEDAPRGILSPLRLPIPPLGLIVNAAQRDFTQPTV